ncbi:sensor histidine kinase [Croceivirga sp. JEA036]|uniref:sensor histidine kinase n=1 Tax=Croceivirga sp. JEA036 TaxID=2721162 RepID=UPI00143C6D86|nr:sensor histidine kinase [Croceivirga sp. JEA036]NJB35651.1 GHKL domain-containing protein [Croceivirga sp. JEA036]
MSKNAPIVFVLILLWSGYCIAQSAKDSLAFYPIAKDVFQASSTQILQDSKGYMWMGTTNGIYRYDGSDFRLFEVSTDGKIGLTDGYIKCFTENEDQNLIIGTLYGVSIYDRALDVVKPYPFKEESQFLQSKYINALYQKDESLWIGTFRNGLFKHNTVSGETIKISLSNLKDSEEDDTIFGIHEYQNSGNYFVVTAGTVFFVTKNKGSQVFKTNEFIQESFLTPDGNTLVLGTRTGKLILLDLTKDKNLSAKEVMVTPNHTILSLATDHHGNIWCGSENAGIAIYNPKTETVKVYKNDITIPQSPIGNSIWSLYQSKDNVMWLGLFKNGLSIYDPNYHKFEHVKVNPFRPDKLNNNIIHCFYEDDANNLYIGTDGGGLNYWNRETDTFTHYSLDNNTLHTNVVLSLLPDGDGNLYVGSWAHGLGILNLKTKNYEVLTTENSFLEANHIFAMAKDAKGRIWIPTFLGGLHWYNPTTKANGTIPLTTEKGTGLARSVSRILIANDGAVWVGTQNTGLYKIIETTTGSWDVKQYHKDGNNDLTNDFVTSIYQDNDDVIWVGTESGLNRYDALTDKFQFITKKEGLIDDAIKAIVQDKNGYHWISTGHGLIQYNDTTKEALHYNRSDGLQGNEFNRSSAFYTKDHTLLFGGSNGFNIFNPEEVKKDSEQPQIVLKNLRIFNKEVLPYDDSGILDKQITECNSVTLSHKHSVFSVDFNALEYGHPERINYAYYLEGFEKQWNYVGTNNRATYTNLNHGEYILRIKATNTDGIWGTDEAKLYITITPPFWKTWWFKMITILSIALLIYLVHFLRLARLKKYQEELEVQIADRTSELQLEKKKLSVAAKELSEKNAEIQKFAFAISHDLKSPTGSIQALTNLIATEIDPEKQPELQEYVNMIHMSCHTMNDLITDITKIAKLGKIENHMQPLDMNKVLDLAHNTVKGKLNNSNIKVKIADNMPVIKGDKNRILQVFSNLLDNAIKYMGNETHPEITVDFLVQNNTIKFFVTDNGLGMDQNALEKLFAPFMRFHSGVKGTGLGLYMVKQIVESHGGTIKASSEGFGAGTTFTVVFPFYKKLNRNSFYHSETSLVS